MKKTPKIKDLTANKGSKKGEEKTWADVVKNSPNNILLEELARERDPQELEEELTKQLNNTKDGRKPDSTVDISRSTLIYNNAVGNAAKRLKEMKGKNVSFSEDSKKEDGGKRVKRRSDRIKEKTRRKQLSAEKFVRALKPSMEMTWGPYRFIKPNGTPGCLYEETMEKEKVPDKSSGPAAA